MATRKSTRKRQPTPSPLHGLTRLMTRPDVVGSILVLVAVFTFLSLITGSRGNLTGAWIDALRNLFGVGMWGVPVVTGVLGLWMVVLAVEQMPDLKWQRPLGVFLLFMVFVVGASLVEPTDVRMQLGAAGEAGGWIGAQIASMFENALSRIGAWALLTFILFASLVFLTDRLLIDFALDLWALGIDAWLQRSVPDTNGEAILPQVPLPRGELPEPSFWQRLLARWDRSDELLPSNDPPNLVRPDTGRPVLQRPTPNQPFTPAAAPISGQAVTPSESEPLTPRIIGASQEWRLPRLGDMLADWERRTDSDELIRQQGRIIQDTLALFGVPADFEGAYKGPSVTQYLIKPGYIERNIKGEQTRIKVKVSKIAGLSNDLALALAAPSVRIEAPIPGTSYVGVEVPNHESNVVGLKELMESETFSGMKGRLKIALGEDVKGQVVVADLSRMPHLLIAGATGSGKSVCINSVIACLLLAHTPDTLRLLMVDPKMVELSVYNGIPHLLSPVVTEVEKASGVLYWAVKEMERRYTLFSKAGTRDLARYNEHLSKRGEKLLPMIVVVVDEMADLMLAAPEDVEKHICRLAQMARATGIHLIIATQRPSVDVITGLIKANFPARIAFAVTSQTDSRVILDVPGAERLLGRGDMLFMAPDASKLERLQGTYLSDDEINRVVRYWKGIRVLDGASSANPPWETAKSSSQVTEANELPGSPASASHAPPVQPIPATGLNQAPLFEQIEAMKVVDGRDSLFDDAVRIVREAGRGSVSLLQRKLRIGYGRAARLVEQLEEAGVLGPDQGGSLGREVMPTGSLPLNQRRPTSPAQQSDGDADEPPSARPRVWM